MTLIAISMPTLVWGSVAFTFVATTEAIGIVGATPVFVDIDKEIQKKCR